MITNGFTDFQWMNIKALGIDHYFDTILVSEQEGIKKPHKDIFLRALKALDVSAEESVYILGIIQKMMCLVQEERACMLYGKKTLSLTEVLQIHM